MRFFKFLAIIATMTMFLVGCQTVPGDAFGGKKDRATFAQQSVEKQKADVEVARKKAEAAKRYNQIHFYNLASGDVVKYEEDGLVMYQKWQPSTRRLFTYETYKTALLGQESLATMYFVTKKDSPELEMSHNRNGKLGPTVLLGNVSVNSTFARSVLERFANVPASSVNGYFGQREMARRGGCKDCDGGDINLTNVGGTANSAAQSLNETGVGVEVQGFGMAGKDKGRK